MMAYSILSCLYWALEMWACGTRELIIFFREPNFYFYSSLINYSCHMGLLVCIYWMSHLQRNYFCQVEAISSTNLHLVPRFRRTKSKMKTSGHVLKSLHSFHILPKFLITEKAGGRSLSLSIIEWDTVLFPQCAEDPKMLFFSVIFNGYAST